MAARLLLAALPIHAQPLRGKVVGVSDGDTLTLRFEGQSPRRVSASV